VYSFSTFQHLRWLNRPNRPTQGRVVCLTHLVQDHPATWPLSSHTEASAEQLLINLNLLSPEHKFGLRVKTNPQAKKYSQTPMDNSVLLTSLLGLSNSQLRRRVSRRK
jgi:hypothetical protein